MLCLENRGDERAKEEQGLNLKVTSVLISQRNVSVDVCSSRLDDHHGYYCKSEKTIAFLSEDPLLNE